MNPSHTSTRDQLAHLLDTLASLAALTVGVAALFVLLGYAVTCTLWPYAVCRRCFGASRIVTRRGRRARHCRRCRSTGLRLRVGRRLWNRLARFRHARREQHRRIVDDRHLDGRLLDGRHHDARRRRGGPRR